MFEIKSQGIYTVRPSGVIYNETSKQIGGLSLRLSQPSKKLGLQDSFVNKSGLQVNVHLTMKKDSKTHETGLKMLQDSWFLKDPDLPFQAYYTHH